MADSARDDRGEPTGAEAGGAPTAVVVSLPVGALGLLASILPGFFPIAWLLGAAALALTIPTFRDGRDAAGYSVARVGAVLGAAALLLGCINLVVFLDAFDYFTTALAAR